LSSGSAFFQKIFRRFCSFNSRPSTMSTCSRGEIGTRAVAVPKTTWSMP
jgi:hypothetical protein